MHALVKGLQLCVVNNQGLCQFALNILLNTEKQALNAANHLHDLLLRAIGEGSPGCKCVLDPLDLLNAHHDFFLRGGLAHGVISRRLRGTNHPVSILFQLLLDLLKPTHHLRMLHLHLLQLTLELIVLEDLRRVLLVDAAQVFNDFCMLKLH